MTMLDTRQRTVVGEPGDLAPRSFRRWRAVWPLFAYVAGATVVTGSVWAHPGRRLLGYGPDPELFVWFLRWTPWAITHGHNPLFTNYVLYPAGANLMWNTAAPLLGVVFWPITATAGPVVAYNLAMLTGFALSAWAAYLAFKRFTVREWPAWIGGALYGFSPFFLGHALGHLHLVFGVAPPLVLLLLHQHLTGPRRMAWRTGVLLGLLVVAQALVGEEMLALTAIGAALWLGCLALVCRERLRPHLGSLATIGGVACAVAAPLLAIPLTWQFLGPQRVNARLFDPRIYSIDLLSFVTPTHRELLAPTWTRDPFDLLSGGPAEAGAFLLPLLLVGGAALFLAGRSTRRSVVAPALTTAVVGLVLAMGPQLHVDGRTLPIPLPARALSGLPLVDNILPARFLLIATLALALLTAVALDLIASAAREQARLGLGIAMLVLVPMLPHPVASFALAAPRFFTSRMPGVPDPAVALFWPDNSPGAMASAMFDQALGGMRFRMVDGYIIAPLRNGQAHYLRRTTTPWTTLMTTTTEGGASPAAYDTARRYLLSVHVTVVLIPSDSVTPRLAAAVSAVTLSRERCMGGTCSWDVVR